MQNTDETKKRIIALLQNKGPSLPVQISREIKMSTLFISAFLSELKDEKKLKMSNLKVGGTPLYLLDGQEAMLENFQQYLHPKEQEALQLLKKNKILKDSAQDPAIRVALRSIKDFSFSFKNDEELYWRFLTVTEQEVKDILEPIKVISKEKIAEEVKKITEEKIIEPTALEKTEEKSEPQLSKPQKKKIIKQEQEILPLFENPLALKPKEPKPEKIKPKSDFVMEVIDYLQKNKITLIEEKEYSKKEYNCISQIKTDLGPIDFLTQAKDKKTISDSDLDLLLRQAQTIPLPALMLYPEALNKKAQEYEKKYFSILKTKKIIS